MLCTIGLGQPSPFVLALSSVLTMIRHLLLLVAGASAADKVNVPAYCSSL